MINILIKSSLYIVLGMFVVLVSVSTGFAQNSELVNFQELSLEISIGKKEFLKLEPIPIAIRVVNNKEYEVTGHFDTDFSHSKTSLFVGKEGENVKRVNQNLSLRISSVKGQNRLIKPKEEQTSLQIVSVKLEKIFPEVGKYCVQVRMIDFTGTQEIISNTVVVEVKEPQEENLQAYNYVKNNAKTDYFFSAFNSIDSLKYVVDNFQNSVYKNYALLNLASAKLAGNGEEEAIGYLESLAKDEKLMFSEVVLSKLVEANLKIGNEEKSKQYLKKLNENFPKSIEAQKSNAKSLSLEKAE